MCKLIAIAIGALLVCATQADSDPNDVNAEILSQEQEIYEDGTYKFSYQTSNGISGQESGVGGYQANGGYAYYSPDGQVIQLTYTADENGFQPRGEHLPTPPPVPAQIQRALDYIKAQEIYKN